MVKCFDEFIEEGMFSGMVRRSNTDQVKKEDNIDNLSPEEFVEYLRKRYDYTEKQLYSCGTNERIYIWDDGYKCGKFKYVIVIYIVFGENTETIEVHYYEDEPYLKIKIPSRHDFPAFFNKISNKYKIDKKRYNYIESQDIPITPSVIIDVIDTLIETEPGKLSIKKRT